MTIDWPPSAASDGATVPVDADDRMLDVVGPGRQGRPLAREHPVRGDLHADDRHDRPAGQDHPPVPDPRHHRHPEVGAADLLGVEGRPEDLVHVRIGLGGRPAEDVDLLGLLSAPASCPYRAGSWTTRSRWVPRPARALCSKGSVRLDTAATRGITPSMLMLPHGSHAQRHGRRATEVDDQIPAIPDCDGRCWTSCGRSTWPTGNASGSAVPDTGSPVPAGHGQGGHLLLRSPHRDSSARCTRCGRWCAALGRSRELAVRLRLRPRRRLPARGRGTGCRNRCGSAAMSAR